MTGASAGIGRALAGELAAAGYTVTGVARDEERLRAAVGALGDGHTALTADLATAHGRARVVQAVRDTRFDVLVNNAGVAVTGPFADVDLDTAVGMMELNCVAPVTLAHAYLAAARPGDALINISSVLAFAPAAGLSVYSASKAFLTSFSESLWLEHRARGVYVMNLCPGITATASQAYDGDDVPASMVQTPEQVAATAIAVLHRRRRPTVVSGRRNTVFAAAMRLLPRRMVLRMLGAAQGPPS
ncbi:SDR family NAD(P)-dependent oxidoreductase [Crossiella sp. CA-258035]|uniref:SDR family NAD(P)-dependent oxidoreductase n=1 Tax=Crossiella sp. CA-258035 TaxID=2981138 RepID=UPI0024BC340B|nr:SDR family NAD(P)-dependent oxidoreductase [Crossiella sp. CA-258035]WHT23356.1 SDR family NAD(P)-dependent oxidoreductase [Crossiella sp. CA-258035]